MKTFRIKWQEVKINELVTIYSAESFGEAINKWSNGGDADGVDEIVRDYNADKDEILTIEEIEIC